MATNTRRMVGVSPEDVFDVLRDGRSYGDWVVGTRRVRRVAAAWPESGTSLHYVAGYAALRKGDRTVSLAYEPDRRLQLEAHAWPFGALAIEIRAEPHPVGTTVTIEEGPKDGLLKALHNPLAEAAIWLRNLETLRRLEQQALLRRAARRAG